MPPPHTGVPKRGLSGEVWLPGCAGGNYDNDCDPDLVQVSSASHATRLFKNVANPAISFTNVASQVGLADFDESRGAAWADFDNDGDLDLYVCNLGLNRLYQNTAGSFVDRAAALGVAGLANAQSWGAEWSDYDGDGYIDLFVANANSANCLYRNLGSEGGFEDVADEASVGVALPTVESYCGVWGDFDSDGDEDLLISNRNHRPTLHMNDGDGTFSEVGESVGLTQAYDWAWGAAWIDCANDGDLDIILASSAIFTSAEGCLIYESSGIDFSPSNTLLLKGLTGAAGVAVSDLNLDGMLDFCIPSFFPGEHPVLAKSNGSIEAGNWVEFRLMGDGDEVNCSAIGTRVLAHAGSWRQMASVSGGGGFCSQKSATLHFGLGSSTAVDSIEVLWPASQVAEVYYDLAANQRYDISKTGGLSKTAPSAGRGVARILRLAASPNPFNPYVEIEVVLDLPGSIAIDVYDISGRLVRSLVSGAEYAAQHRLTWDGKAANGAKCSSGIYFANVKTALSSESVRLVLLK
jgi:enediyne biosynthesis protein E4